MTRRPAPARRPATGRDPARGRPEGGVRGAANRQKIGPGQGRRQARVRQQTRSELEARTQVPLFYPRGCAAPLRGIAAVATLERFVVYCSCKRIISGRAPVRGHEGTGSCSSCYGTRARLVLHNKVQKKEYKKKYYQEHKEEYNLRLKKIKDPVIRVSYV